MSSYRILFFTALVLFSLTTIGWSENGVGVVIDRYGTPQSSVQVQLRGPENYLLITNDVGEFRLKGVSDGKYILKVVSGSRQHLFRGVEIANGNIKPNIFKVAW